MKPQKELLWGLWVMTGIGFPYIVVWVYSGTPNPKPIVLIVQAPILHAGAGSPHQRGGGSWPDPRVEGAGFRV